MRISRGMIVLSSAKRVYIVIDVCGDLCTIVHSSNYRAASYSYELHKSLCTRIFDENGDVVYETV